jgi:hypothetical protein
MGKGGKLEPVSLTTGLTDGRYTEIASGSLKAGDQIVLGASSNSGQSTQVSNPLSGQGQRGGAMGGGPPR